MEEEEVVVVVAHQHPKKDLVRQWMYEFLLRMAAAGEAEVAEVVWAYYY